MTADDEPEIVQKSEFGKFYEEYRKKGFSRGVYETIVYTVFDYPLQHN
jgi:hypothetical protein